MLQGLRQNTPIVVTLLGIALLSMWLSGAHRHRALTHHGHEHEQSLHGHHHHAHDDSPDAAVALAALADSAIASHAAHADQHSDIRLTVLMPSAGKPLADLILLALLACAVFLLRRPGGLSRLSLPDPPRLRHPASSLRPPLRGPPILPS